MSISSGLITSHALQVAPASGHLDTRLEPFRFDLERSCAISILVMQLYVTCYPYELLVFCERHSGQDFSCARLIRIGIINF